MSSKLSIVVPTYNRPESLPRTLRFLQTGPRLPIVVADGSQASVALTNAEACRELGENILYFNIPNPDGAASAGDNVILRLQRALTMVETPYVVCCADDDMLLVESALASVDFLEQNRDYIGCQGLFFGFRYQTSGLVVEHLVYNDASIDGRDICTRLMQLFSWYESPFYCVFLTSVQRHIFDKARAPANLDFLELFHSTAAVVEGRIKRLDNLHYLRNIGTGRASSDPLGTSEAVPPASFIQWLANDLDDLVSSYKDHRSKIIEFAASNNNPPVDILNVKRALDMTFVIYLGRQFHLHQWIDEYLSKNVKCQYEHNRLKARFYRNFGVEWPPPGQTVLPPGRELPVWQRLLRLVRDPSRAVQWLKSRIATREQPTFSVLEGSNGTRLAIRSPLLQLVSDKEWTIVLQRLEQSARGSSHGQTHP